VAPFLTHTGKWISFWKIKLLKSKSIIFGRPFVKRFALCYQTAVCPVLSVCDFGVLWPNSWMDQDATWYEGRPQLRPHCATWGPSSPQKKGAQPPFLAHVYCSQMAGWIRVPLSTEVGLCWGDIVLDEDPAPPTKTGTAAPTFWPMSTVAKRSPISETELFWNKVVSQWEQSGGDQQSQSVCSTGLHFQIGPNPPNATRRKGTPFPTSNFGIKLFPP